MDSPHSPETVSRYIRVVDAKEHVAEVTHAIAYRDGRMSTERVRELEAAVDRGKRELYQAYDALSTEELYGFPSWRDQYEHAYLVEETRTKRLTYERTHNDHSRIAPAARSGITR